MEQTKSNRYKFKWWHAIIGIFLLGALLNTLAPDKEKPASNVELFSNLSAISEIAVKDVLKSPSSAVFPEYYEYEYRRNKDEPDVYYILGYVDAENSFGAQLRNDFVVKCRYVSLEDFEVLGVELE